LSDVFRRADADPPAVRFWVIASKRVFLSRCQAGAIQVREKISARAAGWMRDDFRFA
jgi:hypothetical protein